MDAYTWCSTLIVIYIYDTIQSDKKQLLCMFCKTCIIITFFNKFNLQLFWLILRSRIWLTIALTWQAVLNRLLFYDTSNQLCTEIRSFLSYLALSTIAPMSILFRFFILGVEGTQWFQIQSQTQNSLLLPLFCFQNIYT